MYLIDRQIAEHCNYYHDYHTDRLIQYDADPSRRRPTPQLIDPFLPESQTAFSTSIGLSCCGYDLRLGKEFKTLREARYINYSGGDVSLQESATITTREGFTQRAPAISFLTGQLSEDWDSTTGDSITLEPGQFILGCTVERLSMPEELVGFILDKSSLARRGISVQNTCVEPGFHGILTLEIHNMGNREVELASGMGIAQIVFSKFGSYSGYSQPGIRPHMPYSRRNGKYQNQSGAQPAL